MGIDDDSSSCSSGDDLLNYNYMSQPSPTRTEKKGEPETSAVATNSHELIKNTKPAAKRDASSAEINEERARQTASDVIIDKRLDSPSSLFWHICKKKSQTVIYPVRIPPDESEYIGYKDVLDKRIKDRSKQTVVQFLQFPHAEIKSNDIGLYDVVSRNQLLPFFGKSHDNKDVWCPDISAQYLKQLKQKHKLGNQHCRVEQLYLEKILQIAKDEEADRVELDQYNVAADEPEELKIEDPEPVATTQEEDSDVEDDGKRRSKRRRSCDDNNGEWLHVGDVIQFYKPGYLAAGRENLRQATIVAIHPREDPLLTVDCEGEMNLYIPNDHRVMRVKRIERGSLVDCTGNKYWPVNTFTLKNEGSKNARKKVIGKQVAKVKTIRERHMKETMKKIEEDGCGPTDIFR
jgi:hypothetical protein